MLCMEKREGAPGRVPALDNGERVPLRGDRCPAGAVIFCVSVALHRWRGSGKL